MDKTFLNFIFFGLKNRNTTTFFFQLLFFIPQPAWELIGLLSGHDPVMVMFYFPQNPVDHQHLY